MLGLLFPADGKRGDMNKCHNCGIETELYINGTPTCLKCSDERDKGIKAAGSPLPMKKAAASSQYSAGLIISEDLKSSAS